MSTTVVLSGRISVSISASASKSGDRTGTDVFEKVLSLICGRGDCPTLTGAMSGDLSITGAQDLLLAHATDPLQSCGVAAYSDGFAPAGAALFCLIIVNDHATATLNVARGATNGLPIFSAAGDAMDLGSDGGFNVWYNPAGFGALTTGTNDKVSLVPSAGTVTGRLVALYRA